MADGKVTISTELDNKGFKDGLSKLGRAATTGLKATSVAIASVGTAIASVGGYAVKAGADFEAQMSKVAAISGASADEVELLNEKAKQLGIDTKFSATEAGQAFEYMAMAGWETGDMLDGVSGIMDLAAASGEDLALVSDIVTDAMTAFGLKAEEASHFADVLAKASSSSNTNVAMMGETFKYVAPVAGSLGFSIEDTATAIGLMANAGVKGSQAGTSLRSIMNRLARPTKDVQMAMMDLGYSGERANEMLVDSEGNVKSFGEILTDLRGRFANLDEAEKARVASMLAGQDAMSGLLAIVNTSEEDFAKLTDEIYNADGAAKQMADTMMNNLQGQLTLFKSSAEGFGIAIYESIKEPLTKAASWAVEGLNQITEAFKSGGVDGMVDAVGVIFSEGAAAIASKLPDVVDIATDIIISFVDGISNNADKLADSAISIVEALVSGLVRLLPSILEAGGKIIVSLAEGLIQRIPYLAEKLPDVIVAITDYLTENLPAILKKGQEILVALTTGILKSIPQMVAKLPQVISAFLRFIVQSLPKIVASGNDILLKLAAGIVEAVSSLNDVCREIIENIVNGITNRIASVAEVGKNIVKGLWDGIKSMGSWIADKIKGFFGGIVDTVKGVFGIHSPSKEFAWIGRMIDEGMAGGIEKNIGQVQRAAKKLDITGMVKSRMPQIDAAIQGMAPRAVYGGGYSVNNETRNSIVLNINVEGAPDREEARRAGREIGAETQREMRRRGLVMA